MVLIVLGYPDTTSGIVEICMSVCMCVCMPEHMCGGQKRWQELSLSSCPLEAKSVLNPGFVFSWLGWQLQVPEILLSELSVEPRLYVWAGNQDWYVHREPNLGPLEELQELLTVKVSVFLPSQPLNLSILVNVFDNLIIALTFFSVMMLSIFLLY